jgi:putative ABC transport system permease protein
MRWPAAGFIGLVAFPDLRARALRFAVTAAGMALILAITVLLAGFSAGFELRANRLLDVVGADGYVVVEGAPGAMTSRAPFPAAALDVVRGDRGISRADPLLLVQDGLVIDGAPVGVVVVGAERGGLGWPELDAGRQPAAEREIIADRQVGLDLGDAVHLRGETFEVVGLTSRFTWDMTVAGLVVPLAVAQDVFAGGQEVVTVIAFRGDLTSAPPDGLEVQGRTTEFDDLMARTEAAESSIDAFALMLWVIAVIMVGSVLYVAALERTRDFAVLKATGAPTLDVVAGLAAQALVIGLIAGVVAIALAFAVRPIYPGLISLTWSVYWPVLPIALAISFVGALVGARRAITVDPAHAFGAR